MLSSPAALWIPNGWFLWGWQGCFLLLPSLHSHLCAHQLFIACRHAWAQKYTLATFFFVPIHKYFRVADILTAVSPCDLCVSAAPNLWPLWHHSANPVPLSVAGQQGSWGCRRPRLLFRAAEADMGKEVSNGIGRLSLIDFTSHILLRHNHHWLRNKYVSCLFLFWHESGNMGFSGDPNVIKVKFQYKFSAKFNKISRNDCAFYSATVMQMLEVDSSR